MIALFWLALAAARLQLFACSPSEGRSRAGGQQTRHRAICNASKDGVVQLAIAGWPPDRLEAPQIVRPRRRLTGGL
jgi:hypothetical protein